MCECGIHRNSFCVCTEIGPTALPCTVRSSPTVSTCFHFSSFRYHLEPLQSLVPPFDQNNTCDICMLLNARIISHLPHHVPCCVARWFLPPFGTPSPPSCQGTMQTSSPPTLLVTLSQCPLLLFLYCPASRCWSSPGIHHQVSSFLQTRFLNEIITPA